MNILKGIKIDHEEIKKRFKTSFDEELQNSIKAVKESIKWHIKKFYFTNETEANDYIKKHVILKSIDQRIQSYNNNVTQTKLNNDHSLFLWNQTFLLSQITAYVYWLNNLYSIYSIEGIVLDNTHYQWKEKREYYIDGNDDYITLEYRVISHTMPLLNGKPNKRFMITKSEQIIPVNYDVFDKVVNEELKENESILRILEL